MRRALATLIASAAVLAAVPAAAQTWTDWGEAEGRALVEAENGVVESVKVEANGDLTIDATFDGWLVANLFGFDCQGDGEAKRCKGLSFYAFYEVNDPARAAQLQKDINYTYVADAEQEGDYGIQRDVDLGGGAPLANIRAQLNGFIATNELVAEQVFPAADPAAPASE